MKTNNVDFGKSFKFKTRCTDKIYTCLAVDEEGYCKVKWQHGDVDHTATYLSSTVSAWIKHGPWIVLPTDMKEIVGDIGPELSFQTNAKITDTLLNEIKAFTAISNHSVFIHDGYFEVYQAGLTEFPYKCKDDETLRSVMQALGVLDKVTDNEDKA